MPKLTILTSTGPHSMAETTIEFETKAELDEYLIKRAAEAKTKREGAPQPACPDCANGLPYCGHDR